MIKFINKITDGTHMSESGFHFAAPCAYDFDPAVKAKLDAISINRFDREVDNLWDGFESIWEADDGKFYAVLSVFIGDGCEPAIWAEVVKDCKEENIMKNYRINPDYLSEWGSNATVNTVVSEAEVISLASEWDKSVGDLLNQLEEVDDRQVAAMELADEIRNSATWDEAALSQLCSLAGMEDAWKAADGDSFEAVAYAAAAALGVEI